MTILCVCLITVIVVLGFVLYLALGMFRVSVLDRRDHRKEELAFLGEQAKQGQTVFFGDSITQYCPVEEVYASYTEKTGSLVYNRGIASETSEDALKRLDSSVLALKPASLVILLGCNDIGQKMPASQTVNNIEQIIVKTRQQDPDVSVILQAVYPVRESVKSLPARLLIGSRTCEKIRVLNGELEKLAKRQHVAYLDLTDILSDEGGQLKQAYTMDGLHVNELAYRQIAARVMPLLEGQYGA
ncbi:MAG: GDSL-type esterase/lipase family protein [Candidatus Limivicinus sp.]